MTSLVTAPAIDVALGCRDLEVGVGLHVGESSFARSDRWRAGHLPLLREHDGSVKAGAGISRLADGKIVGASGCTKLLALLRVHVARAVSVSSPMKRADQWAVTLDGGSLFVRCGTLVALFDLGLCWSTRTYLRLRLACLAVRVVDTERVGGRASCLARRKRSWSARRQDHHKNCSHPPSVNPRRADVCKTARESNHASYRSETLSGAAK